MASWVAAGEKNEDAGINATTPVLHDVNVKI